jgi:hypothetical protein
MYCAVLKLLLSRSGGSVNVLGALRKLQGMQREIWLDLPSKDNADAFAVVADLEPLRNHIPVGSVCALATDGIYLYSHSEAGLFKVCAVRCCLSLSLLSFPPFLR